MVTLTLELSGLSCLSASGICSAAMRVGIVRAHTTRVRARVRMEGSI